MRPRLRHVLLACAASFALAAQAQTEPPANPAASLPQWQILQSIQDFAGRGVYAAENARLPAAPANRVVFLGDSITKAWGKTSPFFPASPYLNRGIDGQTTAQMLIRFRQDVIDLKPAVVILQGGLADIAGFAGPSSLAEIEENLRSMAELASLHHISPILVGGPPPADYPGRKGPTPASQMLALNTWVASYCAASHFVYLDYHSALVGGDGQMRADVSDDGVHPNTKGYTILAPLVEAAIAEALKRRPAGAAPANVR